MVEDKDFQATQGLSQGDMGCKTWWHGALNKMTLGYLRFQGAIAQLTFHRWGPRQRPQATKRPKQGAQGLRFGGTAPMTS